MGGRGWRALHRSVYVVGALGVLHFLWLVKADVREPLVYGALYLLLMVARLPAVSRRLPALRSQRRAQPATSAG